MNDYVELHNNYLMHYGVKGMKWGVINSEDPKERAKEYNKQLRYLDKQRSNSIYKIMRTTPKYEKIQKKVEKLNAKGLSEKGKKYVERKANFNKKYKDILKNDKEIQNAIMSVEKVLSNDKSVNFKTETMYRSKGHSLTSLTSVITRRQHVVPTGSKKSMSEKYNDPKNKNLSKLSNVVYEDSRGRLHIAK